MSLLLFVLVVRVVRHPGSVLFVYLVEKNWRLLRRWFRNFMFYRNHLPAEVCNTCGDGGDDGATHPSSLQAYKRVSCGAHPKNGFRGRAPRKTGLCIETGRPWLANGLPTLSCAPLGPREGSFSGLLGCHPLQYPPPPMVMRLYTASLTRVHPTPPSRPCYGHPTTAMHGMHEFTLPPPCCFALCAGALF